jgi:hypothetical protein
VTTTALASIVTVTPQYGWECVDLVRHVPERGVKVDSERKLLENILEFILHLSYISE